ncbi:transposase [Candidatus Dependentiae bacterium]|nr:transposase [Candidatus Dependentiae bacterium]
MFLKRTILSYAFLLVMSTGKKSFQKIAAVGRMSRDTAQRHLHKEQDIFEKLKSIAQSVFQESKNLYIIIDETLIKKIYANNIQGTGYFFDQKTGRRITAFRLAIGMVSDGKNSVPLLSDYLFDKELCQLLPHLKKRSTDVAKHLLSIVAKIFNNKAVVLVADGAYATKEMLLWCKENNIKVEMRMHSNRVVIYKGHKYKLRELLLLKGIKPKGRQMARTITVLWHEMELEITIVRRLDKHDQESIVFQVATYKTNPIKHVHVYQKRWCVEMMIRTTKQRIGIQDCYSKLFRSHIASCLLVFALAQWEKKKSNLKNTEAALNKLERKNAQFLERRFSWILNNEAIVYA